MLAEQEVQPQVCPTYRRGQSAAESVLENGTQARRSWRSLALLVFLGAAIVIPRISGLDRVVSPDEKRWLTHSANFYKALTSGELDQTYQIEHPGVTVMWVGMLAYVWQYPTYAQEAPGQIDWRREEVASFLKAHGRSPLEMLATSHLLMGLTITLVLVAASWWATRLVGIGATCLGFLFIAADPFHIALSRLLHLDGLASSLMLLSLLTLLCYVYRGGRRVDLLISGAVAGLAVLTRSPGLFLVPFSGLVLLAELAAKRSQQRLTSADWQRAASALALWCTVALAVFVLLWPAMWVEPLYTVRRVLRAAVGYAVSGHEDPLYFNGQIFEGDPGWQFYPVTYLWRTTPSVLAGLSLAAAAVILPRGGWLPREQRRPLAAMLLFAVLFTAFMSLGAKKFDRYVLPIYLPLALIAAAGWVAAARCILQRWSRRLTYATVTIGIVLAVVAQAALARAAAPYYLSYYNPLLGGTTAAPSVMMVGWGEGLDQVAHYLNSRSSRHPLRVMIGVWGGTFSYFFKGDIVDSKFAPGETTAHDWMRSDFCVIYINQWLRRQVPDELLKYLASMRPALVVRLQGLAYAYVYDIRDVPPPDYMRGNPKLRSGNSAP
jgi:4-amino-4-deoxy-L-arabinose transferase-like glycosyltransferase